MAPRCVRSTKVAAGLVAFALLGPAACGASPGGLAVGTAERTAAPISASSPSTSTTTEPPPVDRARPALERLEAASDVLVVGTVEAIGPTRANTADGTVALTSRAALDATVALTDVVLRVDAVLGERPERTQEPLVVGEVVHLTLQQGRLELTTTAADRARLGMRTVDDDTPGKPVETTGEQTLTMTFGEHIRLAVGTRYVLYLTTWRVLRADRADATLQILTVTAPLGVVTMVGATPTGHAVLLAEGLTREALTESGRRLSAAAGPTSRFTPGVEGAGQ